MGALPSCQCEWIGDELENLHLQKSKEKTPMHLKHIDDLSPMEREALDETFAAIDLDGDGFISVDELKAYCTQYERVNVDKVADDIMRRLDKDSDGRMDVAELLAANLGGMLENARASSGMYNKVETMH